MGSQAVSIDSGIALNPGAGEPIPMRFIGRQPILDRHTRVFGYELLFRQNLTNRFSGDANDATRRVLDGMLTIDPAALTLGAKAFINCTREALADRLVTFLPPATTVLEVLETVVVDDTIVTACAELKALGYQLALDDYLPGKSIDRLLDLADYIKLDFRACDETRLRQIQTGLTGKRLSLIAEKVETAEEFERALKDGYDYFQGHFFARPSILSTREIPANRLNYLRLLRALSSSPYETAEIERLVMAEPSLCYRLLRMANSAQLGLTTQVTSVRKALMLIGEEQFRKLAVVATATSFGQALNKSPELIVLSLHRARFCELLAPMVGQSASEQYLIGLLSTLDAMLDMPIERLVQSLNLNHNATAALLGHEGPASLPLCIFRCYESATWQECTLRCQELSISEDQVLKVYTDSLQWAAKTLGER